MNAVRLEAPGHLAQHILPSPAAPGPTEALVRIHRVGICGTDLHAFRGRQPFFNYPRIPGHELGVEILELGNGVADLSPGDSCAVEPYLNCGQCIACRRGRPNCCASLQVLGVHLDGGLCEQILVPARKLHPSRQLTFDQLALVETLGIGCHAVDRAGVEPGEFALVIGAGPIGLGVIRFAAAAGARVIVIEANEARLDFCRRHLGVPHALNASRDDLPGALAEIGGGDLPTVVFDATGSAASMMAAFEFPAPGGRLVFVGLVPGDLTFHDPNFHRRELTLLASRNARPEDFGRIIRLLESGRMDPTSWITHRASLTAVPEEFPKWTRPEAGVLKAIVEL